jgi:hypothetical protein
MRVARHGFCQNRNIGSEAALWLTATRTHPAAPVFVTADATWCSRMGG